MIIGRTSTDSTSLRKSEEDVIRVVVSWSMKKFLWFDFAHQTCATR